MFAAVFFSQTRPVLLSVIVPLSLLVYLRPSPALSSPSCPVPVQATSSPWRSQHVVWPVASKAVGQGGGSTVQPAIATGIVDAPSFNVPTQSPGTPVVVKL